MPFAHRFKPSHKEIKTYYEELGGYASHEVKHEGAVSTAFQQLLAATCKKADWHLVPQLSTRIRGKQVRPDGTLRDDFKSAPTNAAASPATPTTPTMKNTSSASSARSSASASKR